MLGKRLEPLTFFYEGVFMVINYMTAERGTNLSDNSILSLAMISCAWLFPTESLKYRQLTYTYWRKSMANFSLLHPYDFCLPPYSLSCLSYGQALLPQPSFFDKRKPAHDVAAKVGVMRLEGLIAPLFDNENLDCTSINGGEINGRYRYEDSWGDR